MKIQILYNRRYIAFDLYINSIYHIFTNNEFFKSKNCNVSIIHDISLFSQDTDFLILFLNDIEIVFNANTNKTKIIFIHADYIINHSLYDQNLMKEYINIKNPANTYIWEYSILNIAFYNDHFSNKKCHFIPLVYNQFLEDLYKSHKLPELLSFHKKEIDILFLGNQCSPRRGDLLNKLSQKYKVVVRNNINSINEYIRIIENSKIVLNIYSKENNKIFDYYRFALLYSNRIFTINETMTNIDTIIEPHLVEFQNIMINIDYDKLAVEIGDYLNKSEEEIEKITSTTYDIFKKNDMNDSIVKFFTELDL